MNPDCVFRLLWGLSITKFRHLASLHWGRMKPGGMALGRKFEQSWLLSPANYHGATKLLQLTSSMHNIYGCRNQTIYACWSKKKRTFPLCESFDVFHTVCKGNAVFHGRCSHQYCNHLPCCVVSASMIYPSIILYA